MSQRTATTARMRSRGASAQPRSSGMGAPRPDGGGMQHGTHQLAATPRISWGTRLRYRFDLTLSRGSGALIGWLAVVTFGFVVVTGVLLHAAADAIGIDGEANGFIENVWDALMRTLDPGTVTGDDGWPYRMASLLITIVGIFIFSTLIGLIASVIDRAIESLRKGRGIVPETEHTIILGWSEKLHTIISELRIANENQHGSCVVVLAPRDRVWMEDEINARVSGNLAAELLSGRTAMGFVRGLFRRGSSGTRVVCRTGNPSDPADLAIVSPTAARSIVVLSEEGAASPDAEVTKIVLGLMSFDRELTGMQVLAEFTDPENATAIHDATAGRVQSIVSGDVIARITAQICRQAGLGAVYQELLDFDGDELYFHAEPRLEGASWGQVLTAYESSSPIGIRRSSGEVQLAPSPDLRLAAGDQVIAISEDDDTLRIGALEEFDPASVSHEPAPELEPDHLLMVGWNDIAPRMLAHLARSAPSGSTLDVVVDPALVDVHAGDLPTSGSLEIRLSHADTSRLEPFRAVLDARDYERIVLVGYQGMPAPEADARTLLGLVHARRVLEPGHRNHGTSIVAELLEPRSVQLGQIANPDDFVVSERITSLLMAQLSENAELADVFRELLDGTGVEITTRPVTRYVPAEGVGTTQTWRELVRAARGHGESAIGYMVPSSDGEPTQVVVNPAKSAHVDLGATLHLIVIG